MYLRTKKYFNIYCFQYRHVFSTEIFAPRYDPIQEVERNVAKNTRIRLHSSNVEKHLFRPVYIFRIFL